MSEQPKQEWRIEIGKGGQSSRVYCNGIQLKNVTSAHLHLKAGAPSTLHLYFAPYSQPTIETRLPYADGVMFHEQDNDEVLAEGTPKYTICEIDGKRFRLVEITEGELDAGLFGEG